MLKIQIIRLLYQLSKLIEIQNYKTFFFFKYDFMTIICYIELNLFGKGTKIPFLLLFVNIYFTFIHLLN